MKMLTFFQKKTSERDTLSAAHLFFLAKIIKRIKAMASNAPRI